MKGITLLTALSLLLYTSLAIAGDMGQQQTIIITDDGNGWVTPVIGAIATLGAAGLGVWGLRRRRKED